MKYLRLTILITCALGFAEVVGWAQVERPNGLFLTTPLSLSSGYESNCVANNATLDDSVTILTGPTVAWYTSTHRTAFSVDYQPEFDIFAHYTNLDAWDHSATLRYSYRATGRLSFEAAISFLSTTDPSRWMASSQFLLPLGRFNQNSGFAGFKYVFNERTQVDFRFDDAFTTMNLPAPLNNEFNLMTNAGTATLDHTFTKHHSITGSYSYFRVRPFDTSGVPGYSYGPVQTADAGYLYTVNPTLLLRATGGAVRGPEWAYTAGGAVEKQWQTLWVSAGFERYLSFYGSFAPGGETSAAVAPFANGLLPNAVFDAGTLRVRGNLTKRIGIDVNGQVGRSSAGFRGVRSLIVQSRLDYKLNNRFTLFAKAEYYGQNVNEFSPFPMSRGGYFGGLDIVLTRPPETVAPRSIQDVPAAPVVPHPDQLDGPQEN